MAASQRVDVLIGQLRSTTDCVSLLKELKTLMLSLPGHELENLVGNVSFTPVFDCLNASDKEQITLGCEMLSKFLSALNPSALLTQFQAELYRGLMHPDPQVKQLVLQQFKRCAAQEHVGLLRQIENSSDVVLTMIRLIADDDLGVVKQTTATLVEIGQSTSGLNILFAPPMVQEMKMVVNSGDVVRFRAYEVMVKLSRSSADGLKRCVEANLLSNLLDEYRQNDILIQLNCLELLSELAISDHGLQHLEEKGVVLQLERMLQKANAECDALTGFLLPGLIKFFGCMAYVRPKEVFEQNRGFVNKLFGFVQAKDSTLLGVAIETIAVIGSSVEGKLTLEKFSGMMSTCMKQFGNLISNAPSDTRVKTLKAVGILLDLKVEEQETELLSLTESWFLNLSPHPMELIVSISQQPFSDLHSAALQLLCALARQPWGQKQMNNHPGFVEYLLNRSSEPDKEGKELKYEVVRILVQSPTSQQIFGNVTMLRLKEYFKDGPFHVTVQAEVAIERSS